MFNIRIFIDTLNRLYQGYSNRRILVRTDYSRTSLQLLKTLCDRGFVGSYAVRLSERKISVFLRYHANGSPGIKAVRLFSTPGRKITAYRYCAKPFGYRRFITQTDTVFLLLQLGVIRAVPLHTFSTHRSGLLLAAIR